MHSFAAAMKLFAPKLHDYYGETLSKLTQSDCNLKPNFKNNVFGAATFNLGPRVATIGHTDFRNLPAGLCAITAIGDFDPKEGGHMLLWELMLMIEFPPGALILIPSAILEHSNTPVRSHEHRYSFTQYSAGGLFRWVECGFKTQKTFLSQGNTFELSGQERWKRGVDMFSTWEELQRISGV